MTRRIETPDLKPPLEESNITMHQCQLHWLRQIWREHLAFVQQRSMRRDFVELLA